MSGSPPPWADERTFPAALSHALGRQAVEVAEPGGRAVLRFESRAEHTHSDGRVVQGGFVTAWLDHAMAVAAIAHAPDQRIATLEIKVSFLAPTGPGPVLAEARVVRWGRTIAFMEAALRTPDGTNLATGTATCRVVTPQPPSRSP